MPLLTLNPAPVINKTFSFLAMACARDDKDEFPLLLLLLVLLPFSAFLENVLPSCTSNSELPVDFLCCLFLFVRVVSKSDED